MEKNTVMTYDVFHDSCYRDDVRVMVLVQLYAVDGDLEVLAKGDGVSEVVEMDVDLLDPAVVALTYVLALPVLDCNSECSVCVVDTTVLGHDVLTVSLVMYPVVVEADHVRISEHEALTNSWRKEKHRWSDRAKDFTITFISLTANYKHLYIHLLFSNIIKFFSGLCM